MHAMRAPEALYRAAGFPAVAGAKDRGATCLVCGTDTLPTLPAKKALGVGFSDYTSIARPDCDDVCAACIWAMTGNGTRTLRLWSIVYGADAGPSLEKAPYEIPGATITNRGNTRPIIRTLCSPPAGQWFVSIAQSGQKHILPYTTVNTGAEAIYTVRFESTDVRTSPAAFANTLRSLARLRDAGFSAEEITTGRLGSSRLTVDTLTTWRALYPPVEAIRTSPLVAMCLWLLTKEVIHECTE